MKEICKMVEKLIGPHEGEEFKLLDSGKKNVALFYDVIPEKYYEYKNSVEYDSIEYSQLCNFENGSKTIDYFILYKINYKDNAYRLKYILQNRSNNYYENGAEIEMEIGKILSYPPKSIEYYIQRLRNRNYIK